MQFPTHRGQQCPSSPQGKHAVAALVLWPLSVATKVVVSHEQTEPSRPSHADL